MKWAFRAMFAILALAALLIAMSGPAKAADTDAQIAAIAELRTEMRQTSASIVAMTAKLEQLSQNWGEFWQRAPVFREQLAESEARARAERARLEARIVNVEQARWIGVGALAVLAWFLWIIRRDMRIRYEPPPPTRTAPPAQAPPPGAA